MRLGSLVEAAAEVVALVAGVVGEQVEHLPIPSTLKHTVVQYT